MMQANDSNKLYVLKGQNTTIDQYPLYVLRIPDHYLAKAIFIHHHPENNQCANILTCYKKSDIFCACKFIFQRNADHCPIFVFCSLYPQYPSFGAFYMDRIPFGSRLPLTIKVVVRRIDKRTKPRTNNAINVGKLQIKCNSRWCGRNDVKRIHMWKTGCF